MKQNIKLFLQPAHAPRKAGGCASVLGFRNNFMFCFIGLLHNFKTNKYTRLLKALFRRIISSGHGFGQELFYQSKSTIHFWKNLRLWNIFLGKRHSWWYLNNCGRHFLLQCPEKNYKLRHREVYSFRLSKYKIGNNRLNRRFQSGIRRLAGSFEEEGG